MITHTFPAMGGSVEVQLEACAVGAAARVEALFATHERALSRFLPDSELCALNASGGTPFAASSLLFDVVRQALAGARAPAGVFDPTLLDALEAAGYNRSWPFATAPAVTTRQHLSSHAWEAIALDARTRTIRLSADVHIDLGGVGKGYTVDRAIALLLAEGCVNAVVNVVGDLYAAGSAPPDRVGDTDDAGGDGDGWLIGVHHSLTPEADGVDIATLLVRDRGVATSGTIRRRWLVGGERYHHLIDARTGRPFDSDVLTVTVVAPTATAADVLAKTAYLLGADAGRRADSAP